MSVLTRSRWLMRLCAGARALSVLGVVSVPSALAQTRTLASLADVPAYVPAPYHSHASTAAYGAVLYDSDPYYGNVHLGFGAHYWH
jgi:hypothetical protein